MVSQNTRLTQASPDQKPQEVILSNIQADSISISWNTLSPSPGFVTFGMQSGNETTVLDAKDTKETLERTKHYVNIKNLTPNTTYQFRIVSGNKPSEVMDFTTANSTQTQNTLQPVIGSVINQQNQAVTEGIAFLTIPGAALQSSPISNLGSFTIPLSKVYNKDLSNALALETNTQVLLKIITPQGEASVSFPLANAANPLPTIQLGQNIENLVVFDLNGDGLVNVSDYSMALKNKGKKLNGTVIDQDYLNELTQKVNQSP